MCASFFQYYCELKIGPAVYDVTYDDMLKVVKQVEVEIHSLDQLFSSGELQAKLRPDFLSLDTQGLERDIMEGAQRVIQEGVLGIVAEVEIASMYEGHPLLGDVLHVMNSYGFHFAGFTNLQEISPYRAPIGLRGKSFPGFGDALFLRKVETFERMGLSNPELFLKASTLAFISLVFGHVEYALKALSLATSLRSEVQSDILKRLGDRTYFGFLRQVEVAAREVESLHPPIFGIPDMARLRDFSYLAPSWYDLHHEEAVKNFHELKQPGRGTIFTSFPSETWANRLCAPLRRLFVVRLLSPNARIRDLILTRPHQAIAKIVYYSAVYIQRAFLILSGARLSVLNARRERPRSEMMDLPEEGYSSFELVLVHHGLTSVADTVRQKRVAAEQFVRSLRPGWREAGQRNAPFSQP